MDVADVIGTPARNQECFIYEHKYFKATSAAIRVLACCVKVQM